MKIDFDVSITIDRITKVRHNSSSREISPGDYIFYDGDHTVFLFDPLPDEDRAFADMGDGILDFSTEDENAEVEVNATPCDTHVVKMTNRGYTLCKVKKDKKAD